MLPPSTAAGPLPAVAHLRVYEPLSTVAEPQRSALARALVSPLPSVAAALRTEQAAGVRFSCTGVLPAAHAMVGVLEPAQVSGGAHRVVGPGTVVCPWDTPRRSAAGVLYAEGLRPVGFRDPDGIDDVDRAWARAVLTAAGMAPVHVLSSTWAVPLSWFALVDPSTMQLISEPGLRRPVWRVAMADVRVRAARALLVCEQHLGRTSTVLALADVVRWLSRFPEGCAVELDYAGLGRLLDDDALAQDRSCLAVNRAISQLEHGHGELVKDTLAPVLAYWARVRSWQHAN